MKTQPSSLDFSHFPVMLSEVIRISSPKNGGMYLDCTFGGGGYSKAFLKFQNTRVIAIDRDNAVISIANELHKKNKKRFRFFRLKFSQIDKILTKDFDTVVFDLGLSSIQLNNLKRGFSFKSKDSLDMTMGLSDVSAEDVINNLSEEKLKLIIKILGEEKEASKIAKNIAIARLEKRITRVDELVKIIEKSKKKKLVKKINPSTKTFQALRIFVNKEISELIYGLINATKVLKKDGILAVVSFHSLEDKIVKYFLKSLSERKSLSRYEPKIDQPDTLFILKQKKPIIPSANELKENISSRSAKLRYVIKKDDVYNFETDILEKFKFLLDIENLGNKL